MNKVLLVYWPEKGNVDLVADKFIQSSKELEIQKVSILNVNKDLLEAYDNWIIGGSTVGSHVWEDADDSNRWFEFFKLLNEVDLTKKVVAFYGLGDQILYPHHFVDGLGVFQEEFEKRNANIIGQWPIDGYQFYDSDGMHNKKFYGLALDEDHQPEKTEERINGWIELIRKEFK
ncbi:MAG: flavodoxin domain-containing protein [Bacteroidetes bacterium]|nr:flavodoxin domain-containing protein [Bacteroidota bacterium]